jgi:hypothetical protein
VPPARRCHARCWLIFPWKIQDIMNISNISWYIYIYMFLIYIYIYTHINRHKSNR